MNVNKFFGVGRLAMDPQLKSYKNAQGEEGARVFFTVAITRIGDRGKPREQQRTNYIGIVAWGEAAKRHAQYLQKGTEVSVEGELIWESQKQADGSFRQFIAVQAHDIQYGRKSQKNTADAQTTTKPITAPVAIGTPQVTKQMELDFESYLSGGEESTPFGAQNNSPLA